MTCPCCGASLWVGFSLQENSFVAWCGNIKKCRSVKANDGEFGRTEEQAQLNLIAKLENKPDWKDDE